MDKIPPASKDLDISVGPIKFEETNTPIAELKNGKAPGCDYLITPEVTLLKYGGTTIVQMLTEICNDVYQQETAPRQLTTNIIVALPKKVTSL
jgi:hypothetical protein